MHIIKPIYDLYLQNSLNIGYKYKIYLVFILHVIPDKRNILNKSLIKNNLNSIQ